MDRTRKRDGRTDGRTVRLLYASQSSFGGIKIKQEKLTMLIQLPFHKDKDFKQIHFFIQMFIVSKVYIAG